MKNIWIIHHYATAPNKGGYQRPYNFALHLKNKGIKVKVFCASYNHWQEVDLIADSSPYEVENADGIEFVYVKTPSSAKGGYSRIWNMLIFSLNVGKIAQLIKKQNNCRPDVIIASSPHPFSLISGILLAKKNKVPCISEIRDLWPEAIFKGSRLKEKSLVGRLLVAGEYWIYKNSSALIFTKEGDIDYLKEHGWLNKQGGRIKDGSCFYINNGIDYIRYKEDLGEYQLEDEDLNDESFKVVYTGAIRPINNMSNIIEAAKILKNESNIKFLIFGEGNQKTELEKLAQQYGLTNVVFKGYVENKYIPYVLSKSSVNILNYSSTMYNWNRGSSSNKLFEYMASGKPIISTVKMGYSIINKYSCGIELDNYSPRALADAIIRIKNVPNHIYNEYCNNALLGVREFDYSELTKKLLDVLEYVSH